MTYPIPSAEHQLQFLHKIQRILEEGDFNATYKYALLQALSDIAVEKGDVVGEPLIISIEMLAEKYIMYYWRQVLPFPRSSSQQAILFQNKGKQAAIINQIKSYQDMHGPVITRARKNLSTWKILVKDVADTIRAMPLWKLQRVAHGVNDFLYPNKQTGDHITLRPGIAYCLRAFHGQILNMVQGAWLRWVRSLKGNQSILGQSVDLNEFLFGSDRTDLSRYVPILQTQQDNLCFYCNVKLKSGSMEVDHFIPWARYPLDLGHNFVLADRACNNDKRDLLPSISHLERWVNRNVHQRNCLEEKFDQFDLPYDRDATHAIAAWAYSQVELTRGDVWLSKKGKVEPLGSGWHTILSYDA